MATSTSPATTRAPERFSQRLLAPALGCEISGVDLSTELDDETVADLRAAFNQHQVLVFRDQTLNPDQQMAFGRRFGELDTHPFVEGSPDRPEVLDIVTEPDDRLNFGGGWHSDVTFLERPDLGSILYGVELPPLGGDTLFSSQRAAYAALSSPMKELLDPLTAVHSAGRQYSVGGLSTQSTSMKTKNAELAAAEVVHPVVQTHPETGDKALYVNPAFTTRIRGLRAPESEAILEFLFAHAVREPFTLRVGWQPGTVVMWDNRSVQHYALHDYAGERRHVRRITIKGGIPA